jgi:peptide chain release factor 2
MIEFEENKVKLNDMKPALSDLREALALDAARDELERLHAQIASDGFWDNLERAQKVQREASQLENKIKSYEDMEQAGKTC